MNFLPIYDQRVFTHAEIWTDLDARGIMKSIVDQAISDIAHRCRDMSLAGLEAELARMNGCREDVSNRFVYCDFFGGLVFCQLSCREEDLDNCWHLLPRVDPIELIGSIDYRGMIGIRSNGLFCIRAPESVQLQWLRTPPRHMDVYYAGRYQGHLSVRKCSQCDAEHGLKRCNGCELIRHCGRACQRANWREHRVLCRWAAACLSRNFE